MIKIKIKDPLVGKNKNSFIGFLYMKDLLRQYHIDITESDDYDYLFIGANEFYKKGESLSDSVEYGLNNISKITGDYIMFDGSDSTSLIGAYEVFEQSNALYLLKNAKLKNRKDYVKPSPLNKWFFFEGSDLDIGYDIPEDKWKRIRTTGFNLGYLMASGHFRPNTQRVMTPSLQKPEDVCAIYQGIHFENYEHKARNDQFYTNHRKGAWDELNKIKSKYKIHTDKLPYPEYVQIMRNSKLALSPYGMGEICYRDFELMEFGTAMIKPDMSKVETNPDYFVDGETYFAVKPDWSDLNEKIETILKDPQHIQYVAETAQKKYMELYNPHNFCMYWYNFFSNLDNIVSE
jgi:glycosyltransferase involved in cell wall biosynthesis